MDALVEAVTFGQVDEVRALLSQSPSVDISAPQSNGLTLLHEAAAAGHAVVVKMLVGAGASPAALDEDGQTALHHAANEGHEEVVKLLAPTPECSELFVLDNYQMTPYHLACENGHAGCVGHLLSMLDQQPQETQRHRRASQMRRGSALFLAEKAGHADVVEIINSARSYGEDDGGQTSECSSSASSSSSRSRLDGGDADDQARADPAIGQPGQLNSQDLYW